MGSKGCPSCICRVPFGLAHLCFIPEGFRNDPKMQGLQGLGSSGSSLSPRPHGSQRLGAAFSAPRVAMGGGRGSNITVLHRRLMKSSCWVIACDDLTVYPSIFLKVLITSNQIKFLY